MKDIIDKYNKIVSIGARRVKEHNAQIRANYIGGAYCSGPEALRMLKKKLMRIPKKARSIHMPLLQHQ